MCGATALVAVDADETVHPVVLTGWPELTTTADIYRGPALSEIDLGMWRNRRWHLICDVLPTIEACSAFAAVRRLGCLLPGGRERSKREPASDLRFGRWILSMMRRTAFLRQRRCSTLSRQFAELPRPQSRSPTGETGTGKDILARMIHESLAAGEPDVRPLQLHRRPPRDARQPVVRSPPRSIHRRAGTGPGVIRGAGGGPCSSTRSVRLASRLR